jgi:hypothetical protein
MLLLVLLAGCRSTEPVSEAPVVEPDVLEETVATEPQQPSVPRPTQEIALRGEIALDHETLLRVTDVIVEQIEASPDDPQSYPSGNGISVTLAALRGAEEQQATLTLLSAGYESQPEGVLHGYRITLLDVEDPDRSPRAVLAIEPAE